MTETIESERAKKIHENLIDRIASRMPVVISCALLHTGLSYPTLLCAAMFQTSTGLISYPLSFDALQIYGVHNMVWVHTRGYWLLVTSTKVS